MADTTELRRIMSTVRRSRAICLIHPFQTHAIFAGLRGPIWARLFDSACVWRTTANPEGTIALGYVLATVILSELVCLMTADLEGATFNCTSPILPLLDRIHHPTKQQCAVAW